MDRGILRADRQVSIGQGEAGLTERDTGIVGGQPHGAVAAGAGEGEFADVRTAADAARSHGE